MRTIRLAFHVIMAAALLGATACSSSVDEAEGTTDDELQNRCTDATAARLATAASKVSGRRSSGHCYRYVKAHLRAAGLSTSALEANGFGASAYMFSSWAKQNPAALAKMGLVKSSAGLDALPKGALIVWPRGMCGYNKTHGHIEVVVDSLSSRACSDFCGRIKKGCGTPDIYVPKGCVTDKPVEADDDDDSSIAAPAEDGPSAEADAPEAKDDGGTCWSATLQEEVEAHTCVLSSSTGLWFQCHEGKWYRGVSGDDGPFGACRSKRRLGEAEP